MKEQHNHNRYSEIVRSESFQKLLAKKKRFILPMSIFFLVFYFVLPIMTSYTKVLNEPAIGSITWAWLFAFAQFIMTWVLCSLYSRKAAEFDALSDRIKAETETANQRKAG
ncbi:DUF485 domain-containing protein [Paenibacillus sp. GCM10023248]|uniref:DUF485 domain-containing protein n=1 Tax=Bacillales TaxID=1385 RepID=UPI00237872CE|nr:MULTISPECIES: DUF485 domain-containing protein [Bacillales]MDD9266098.1 DUF485 domain-containing protein [Paenibacillus sp. MAHUQ-63]MDR6878274.1 uncharacterized membrane protein (DUF485 family) [Bacillus sp. 3255]